MRGLPARLLRATDPLQRPLLLTALAAPQPLRRLLSGPPVVVHGRTLDPELQIVLRLQRLTGGRVLTSADDLSAMRADMRRQTEVIGGRPPIDRVEDLTAPGPAGPVPVRLYVPRGAPAVTPLLVFLHGGGWVEGDLDTHDPLCRVLAEQTRVRVLAVDYRLAPEHPCPAAVDDAWAVVEWVAVEADSLGADPGRVGVAGDSAGGNLAAVVAQRAAASGIDLAMQLLIYPATDMVQRRPSRHLLADGFFLTDAFMVFAEAAYVPDPARRGEPVASPLRAPDLSGLAPAVVVTAGFDPLRDEGHEYAAALAAAGVPVEYWCEDAMTHGYTSFTGAGRSTAAALARLTAAVRHRLQ